MDQIDRWNGRGGAAAPAGEPANGQASGLEQLDQQIAALTGTVANSKPGCGDWKTCPWRPRKPMHVRLAECGGPGILPAVLAKNCVLGATIVIPAGDDETHGRDAAVGAGQTARLEAIVIGPEPGPRLRQTIDASAGRCGMNWSMARSGSASTRAWPMRPEWAAAMSSASSIPASACATAAGAVMRFFRDHPRTMAAYFERIVRQRRRERRCHAAGGWMCTPSSPSRARMAGAMAAYSFAGGHSAWSAAHRLAQTPPRRRSGMAPRLAHVRHSPGERAGIVDRRR